MSQWDINIHHCNHVYITILSYKHLFLYFFGNRFVYSLSYNLCLWFIFNNEPDQIIEWGSVFLFRSKDEAKVFFVENEVKYFFGKKWG